MLAVLKLYAQLARKAAVRAARGWPALIVLLVYPYAILRIGALLAPLGMLGGFILALIIAFAISSYLYFVAGVVSGTKVRLGDIKGSFTAHFSDTMSVLFSLWLISIAVNMLTRGMGERAQAVQALVGIAMFVLLNPIPEVIYQRRVGGGWFTHLGEAGRFIIQHWPAWLLPNIVLGALLIAPVTGLLTTEIGGRLVLLSTFFSATGIITLLTAVPLWLKPIMLLYIHFAMVWRGLLFEELSSGISTRQRAIRDAWGRDR